VGFETVNLEFQLFFDTKSLSYLSLLGMLLVRVVGEWSFRKFHMGGARWTTLEILADMK
jgi:hypothetical protein